MGDPLADVIRGEFYGTYGTPRSITEAVRAHTAAVLDAEWERTNTSIIGLAKREVINDLRAAFGVEGGEP